MKIDRRKTDIRTSSILVSCIVTEISYDFLKYGTRLTLYHKPSNFKFKTVIDEMVEIQLLQPYLVTRADFIKALRGEVDNARTL
jgi:hypothetical protein